MLNQNKLLHFNSENNAQIYRDTITDDIHTNQLWDIEWVDNKQSYRVWSVCKPGHALTWWSTEGYNVLIFDPQGNNFTDGFWDIIANNDGSYSFRNKESDRSNGKEMMLDITQSSDSDSTNVQV